MPSRISHIFLIDSLIFPFVSRFSFFARISAASEFGSRKSTLKLTPRLTRSLRADSNWPSPHQPPCAIQNKTQCSRVFSIHWTQSVSAFLEDHISTMPNETNFL